jgi:hypothetical protein
MISPQLWSDEKIAKLDFLGRLFWVGLLTCANDYGKLRGSPEYLASIIFPYDRKIKLDKYIELLVSLKRIYQYVVDGETYLKISNWDRYQKVDHPSKDEYPDCDENDFREFLARDSGEHRAQEKLSKEKLSQDKISAPAPVNNKILLKEYVQLTQQQIDKLQQDLGVKKFDLCVSLLDNHIGAKGKDPYKSHYHAILKWVVSAVEDREKKCPSSIKQSDPDKYKNVGH